MSSEALRQLFRDHFKGKPEVLAHAPGRVNLIGEHTDYNDGFVFPAAIDYGVSVAAARTDGSSKLFSVQRGEAAMFDVSELSPGTIENWSKYAAGMAWALGGLSSTLPNVVAVVDSTLPIGSGVSSSAALELAFGVVYRALATLDVDNATLARLGQKCENQFVGVNCGIMDQMASAMGREGCAMFFDTRSLEISYARIPDSLAIVLLDTKKARALTDSAYNERRTQCEAASTMLGVPTLRDADSEMLSAAEGSMPELVFRRARHVITENARCVDFAAALDAADFASLGNLMRRSHESLRDDYQVSCDELDAMACAAWDAPGTVGARMTGAGFGGACVALVDVGSVEQFIASTLGSYRSVTGREGAAMRCRAVEGARVV